MLNIKASNTLRKILSRLDIYLFLCVFVLLLFGTLEIWSTSPELAQKQVNVAVVGIFLMLLSILIEPFYLRLITPGLFFFSLVLLLLAIFFGSPVRGANRWLPLGPLSFQVSEFAKLGLILGFAWIYSERKLVPRLRFILSLVILGIFCGLVFLQPDLGTGFIFVSIWLFFAFCSLTPFFYILGLVFLALCSSPFIWKFLKPYQQGRILSFLNPRSDPLGAGYNVLQAVIAVGSGQLWGRGLGRGPQSQLQFLPERSTDFIFASLAEEWGLVGCSILFIFYFILLWRVVSTARRASSSFGMLVCIGVFSMLLSQFFINVGMNVGIMPITGLTLPLVSAGGSSLLTTLLSLGLVEAIYFHSKISPRA